MSEWRQLSSRAFTFRDFFIFFSLSLKPPPPVYTYIRWRGYRAAYQQRVNQSSDSETLYRLILPERFKFAGASRYPLSRASRFSKFFQLYESSWPLLIIHSRDTTYPIIDWFSSQLAVIPADSATIYHRRQDSEILPAKTFLKISPGPVFLSRSDRKKTWSAVEKPQVKTRIFCSTPPTFDAAFLFSLCRPG